MLVAFTDGACTGNGKKTAKAGVGIFIPDLDNTKISMSLPELNNILGITDPLQTNQRAELLAIYYCILTVFEKRNKTKLLTIYSDSVYSINCVSKWCHSWISNNWIKSDRKPVLNQDLIKMILELMKKIKVVFIHCKAHTKMPDACKLQTCRCQKNCYIKYGNYIADSLAVESIKK